MTDVMPEKIDLETVRLGEEKLAQLRQLIPEAFSDGRIDFDALRRSLGDAVDTSPKEERFGLRWPGKSQLQQVINQPSVGTLVPQPEESVDWDTTQNLIIEGDNLEVLKLLQKSYAGQVKMIYIDPPYNTGNDFVYPDNFTEGLQTYLEFTGQVDGNGRKMQSNTETTGRYHANWLNMMYPRLYLARNLLRQDGVLFASINEVEISSLLGILNEVFGEDNREGVISWRRRYNQPNDRTKLIGTVAEYIVCYVRNKSALKKSGVGKVEVTGSFSNPDGDPRGDWASKPWKVGSDQSGSQYVITTPTGIQYDEKWMGEESTFRFLLGDGRILFPDRGNGPPRKKYYRSEREEEGQCATNWWRHEEFGHNQGANQQTEELFGEKNVFSNPKPIELLGGLVQLSNARTGDIVLDFFAGSGTAGHAVMQQNAEDGGNRRYIMVQLPEPLGEPKTLDDGTRLTSVADICRERVRRAGKKISAESKNPVDTGFRAYRLAPSNFRPWDGRTPELMTSARQASFMPQNRQLSMEERLLQAADHIRADAEDDALLAELLLKIGFDLTTPVAREQMAGKTVYNIENGTVLICLDRLITLDVIERMAARTPAEIICLDAGFPNDQTKVNAGQIIASHARDEETSIAFKVV